MISEGQAGLVMPGHHRSAFLRSDGGNQACEQGDCGEGLCGRFRPPGRFACIVAAEEGLGLRRCTPYWPESYHLAVRSDTF